MAEKIADTFQKIKKYNVWENQPVQLVIYVASISKKLLNL